MAAPLESDSVTENVTDSSETCLIEASVVTGLENLAKEEAIEKLNASVLVERGCLRIQMPVSQVTQVLNLSSVDNLYVVIEEKKGFDFGTNLDEALEKMSGMIPSINWQHGLKVWSKFIPYDGHVSHLPENKEAKPANIPVCNNDEEKPNQGDCKEPVKKSNVQVENAQQNKNDSTKATGGDKNGGENLQGGKRPAEGEAPEGEPPQKVRKVPHREGRPAFRVTCHRAGGKHQHVFQSPQAASHFGGAVQEYFGWNVDLKNFNIEVVLNISGSDVCILLALTKMSLHRRNITHFGPTTLRPTIAYGLLRFCQLKEGEIVCDPMCGGGSIPIEGALGWPNTFHLCGDLHEKAWNRAQDNITAINDERAAKDKKSLHTNVASWDATCLPLRDESVDVFITDMPFGKRSGSKMNNWHLYPKVLTEMARCSKLNSGRACLLTQDKKCISKALQGLHNLWRRGPTININIGGLLAGVYLLHRTATAYEKATAKSRTKENRQQKEEECSNAQKVHVPQDDGDAS